MDLQNLQDFNDFQGAIPTRKDSSAVAPSTFDSKTWTTAIAWLSPRRVVFEPPTGARRVRSRSSGDMDTRSFTFCVWFRMRYSKLDCSKHIKTPQERSFPWGKLTQKYWAIDLSTLNRTFIKKFHLCNMSDIGMLENSACLFYLQI